MKEIFKKKLQNIVIGQLNINSLRNKSDLLAEQTKRIIDVLVNSVIKLDESFLVGQFRIPEYASPFHLDGDQHWGEIMAFIREDIPAKFYLLILNQLKAHLLSYSFTKESGCCESCSYDPNENNIMNHLDVLRKTLALYSLEYEHVVLLGDFNVETKEPCTQSFLELHGLRNLISEPTCSENPEKLSSIDLIFNK